MTLGKIDEGEVCDCGTVRNCDEMDPCCIPRGRNRECQVNHAVGFECHPSQGLCCSNNCLIRDLSDYDLVN